MPFLHEVWPGNNRFCCGCCISGPPRQCGGIIYIYVCLLGILIPFSIFIVGTTWEVTPALPILFYLCIIIMQIFMFLTNCTDPGIIPRRPFLDHDRQKFKLYLEQQRRDQAKFCQTCHIYRPPKASHCSSCQNCVQSFDHHCGVVGNCIGKRNYRYFVMFVGFTFLSVLMAVINTIIFIIKKSDEDINQTAIIVIVSVIGAVLGLPLLCFFGFHIFMAVTGNTTRQYIKKIQNVHDNDNQWCSVDEPLFDPFQQISQQRAQSIHNNIQSMRRPMAIIPTIQNQNQNLHPDQSQNTHKYMN